MTTFRFDIHDAQGWAGNLVDIADQFPVRASFDFDAPDNTSAMEHAKTLMVEWGGVGDIGRLLRLDDDQWSLLGEVHR